MQDMWEKGDVEMKKQIFLIGILAILWKLPTQLREGFKKKKSAEFSAL